jgi:hypothetical protein
LKISLSPKFTKAKTIIVDVAVVENIITLKIGPSNEFRKMLKKRLMKI